MPTPRGRAALFTPRRCAQSRRSAPAHTRGEAPSASRPGWARPARRLRRRPPPRRTAGHPRSPVRGSAPRRAAGRDDIIARRPRPRRPPLRTAQPDRGRAPAAPRREGGEGAGPKVSTTGRRGDTPQPTPAGLPKVRRCLKGRSEGMAAGAVREPGRGAGPAGSAVWRRGLRWSCGGAGP